MSRAKTVSGTKEDPTVPFVPLTLKGIEYKLCYSFNALAKAEALTGLNMFQGLDLKALNITQLRAMLWATLLTAQPDMTLEDVGDLIASPTHCNLALTALAAAWTASMPKPEAPDPNA
jgi:hypothetical protein